MPIFASTSTSTKPYSPTNRPTLSVAAHAHLVSLRLVSTCDFYTPLSCVPTSPISLSVLFVNHTRFLSILLSEHPSSGPLRNYTASERRIVHVYGSLTSPSSVAGASRHPPVVFPLQLQRRQHSITSATLYCHSSFNLYTCGPTLVPSLYTNSTLDQSVVKQRNGNTPIFLLN